MAAKGSLYFDRNEVHAVFKNDPLKFRDLLYKFVQLTTVNGNIHKGWVKTIDPVSESFVLLTLEEDKVQSVEIVLGHAIKNIDVLSEDTKCKNIIKDMFSAPIYNHTSVDNEKRQSQLKSWFLKNRLPVREIGESGEILEVAGVLTVCPPYGTEHCLSTNEIILGKIQKLILLMPENDDV